MKTKIEQTLANNDARNACTLYIDNSGGIFLLSYDHQYLHCYTDNGLSTYEYSHMCEQVTKDICTLIDNPDDYVGWDQNLLAEDADGIREYEFDEDDYEIQLDAIDALAYIAIKKNN